MPVPDPSGKSRNVQIDCSSLIETAIYLELLRRAGPARQSSQLPIFRL